MDLFAYDAKHSLKLLKKKNRDHLEKTPGRADSIFIPGLKLPSIITPNLLASLTHRSRCRRRLLTEIFWFQEGDALYQC